MSTVNKWIIIIIIIIIVVVVVVVVVIVVVVIIVIIIIIALKKNSLWKSKWSNFDQWNCLRRQKFGEKFSLRENWPLCYCKNPLNILGSSNQ